MRGAAHPWPWFSSRRREATSRTALDEPGREHPEVWTARHGGRDRLDSRQHRAGDRLLLRIRSYRSNRRRCRSTDDSRRRRGRCSPGIHSGRVHQGRTFGRELHHLCRDGTRTKGWRRHSPFGHGRLHRRHGGGVHHVRRDGGADHRSLHVVAHRLGTAHSRTDRRCHLAHDARRQAFDDRRRRGRAPAGSDHGRGLHHRPDRSTRPSLGCALLVGTSDRRTHRPLRRLPTGPLHVHRMGERSRAGRRVPNSEAHHSEGPIHLGRDRRRPVRLLRLFDRHRVQLRRLLHRALLGPVPHRGRPLFRRSGHSGLARWHRLRARHVWSPARTRKRACCSTAVEQVCSPPGSAASDHGLRLQSMRSWSWPRLDSALSPSGGSPTSSAAIRDR